jgi:hypothetical protein
MLQSGRADGDGTFVAASESHLIGMCPSGRIPVISLPSKALYGTFAGS